MVRTKKARGPRPLPIYVQIYIQTHGDLPWLCGICHDPKRLILKRGARKGQGNIHHIDGDHSNNDPANLMAAHHECHAGYHATGRPVLPETRQKLSEQHSGVPKTDEQKAAQSAAWNQPGKREAWSEAIGEAKRKPEARNRQTELNNERWSDPEYRKRVSEANKESHATEEARATHSENNRKTWQDPEVRARRIEGMKRAAERDRGKRVYSDETRKLLSEASNRRWAKYREAKEREAQQREDESREQES